MEKLYQAIEGVQGLHRALFFGLVSLVIVAIVLSGYFFPIDPVSDFALYWERSTDFSMYIKGGGLLLIYGGLKLAGFSPSVSGVMVASSAYLLFAWAIWPTPPVSFTNKWKTSIGLIFYCGAVLAILAYGLLWYPMAAFTEVMFIHTALLVVGLKWIFQASSRAVFLWGMAICTFALTMRMHSVLLIAGMAIGAAFLASVYYRKFLFPHTCLALCVCCLVASVIEWGLCAQSADQTEIKLNQRTPLYTGLLVIKHHPCGVYYPPAHEAAAAELSLPLTTAVEKHLREKPVASILSDIKCKLEFIFVHTHAIASEWGMGYRATLPGFTQKALAHRIVMWDKSIFTWLKRLWVVGLLMALILGLQHPKTRFLTFCFIALLLSYVIVFSIFETNLRYLIPFYGLGLWWVIYIVEEGMRQSKVYHRPNG